MKYIKSFKEITKNDISLIGGKGLSLGIMTTDGIPVPPGFVITTHAFKDFYNRQISEDFEREILQIFDSLEAERVAVRSSAVAEDSATASWAGQLETYLNVSKENLLESVKKCWASLYSERALAYAQRQGFSNKQQAVAVVIQKMINSEVSGVLFTVNPVTKNVDEIMIEAIYGLGEPLVQGTVIPFNFVINRHTLSIKSKDSGEQEKMLISKDGENKEVLLPENLRHSEILNTEDLEKLCSFAIKIENIYKKPQDIEWSIDSQGKIWILQSRPITSL